MPWTQTCVMDERAKFIIDVLDGTYSMVELCDYSRISRKTGYKWLQRYRQGGMEALQDRSRAPLSHPHEISHQVKQAILAIKKRFPKWGAPKIRVRLRRERPGWQNYPAISTIGLFLQRQGLTCRRKRRRRATPTESPLTSGRYSNQVWCADFKGHFKTADGSRCNPLTISDHASRYLLCCRHVDRMSYKSVKMHFERVFSEYGLPEVIRTDNGTPFASRGLVRFYRTDDDGQLEFTGENYIDHTPKDEKVRVYTGNAFYLVGERTRTDYTIDTSHDWLDEAFEIRIRNRKEKDTVEFRVVEHLYRRINWDIVKKSHDFEKTDSQTIEFPVEVPPGAEKVITYKVYYTW